MLPLLFSALISFCTSAEATDAKPGTRRPSASVPNAGAFFCATVKAWDTFLSEIASHCAPDAAPTLSESYERGVGVNHTFCCLPSQR